MLKELLLQRYFSKVGAFLWNPLTFGLTSSFLMVDYPLNYMQEARLAESNLVVACRSVSQHYFSS